MKIIIYFDPEKVNRQVITPAIMEDPRAKLGCPVRDIVLQVTNSDDHSRNYHSFEIIH